MAVIFEMSGSNDTCQYLLLKSGVIKLHLRLSGISWTEFEKTSLYDNKFTQDLGLSNFLGIMRTGEQGGSTLFSFRMQSISFFITSA